MIIYLSRDFIKRYKKLVKHNPKLKEKIKKRLELLKNNLNHPLLKLHKLKGKRVEDWSISIETDMRMVFTYVKDGILFVDIGSHDEVYG